MSEQTVVTARMPFIRSAHTESSDGTCDLCLVVWPCDTGVVLAELARLTGDVAALREQLAEAIKVLEFAKAYDDHRLDCSEHPYPCMTLAGLWGKMRPRLVAVLTAGPRAAVEE